MKRREFGNVGTEFVKRRYIGYRHYRRIYEIIARLSKVIIR